MEKKPKKALSHLRNWFISFLLAFALILLWDFCSSLRICEATGLSMAPTINNGDRILWRLDINPSMEAGDIVVLTSGHLGVERNLIKRVIAVSGQHVVVDYAANAVYVDGVALDEPYVKEPMQASQNPSMTLLDVTVPPGCVYVLGDNRNHSADSRHQQLGCVHTESVWGKVLLRLSPHPAPLQ